MNCSKSIIDQIRNLVGIANDDCAKAAFLWSVGPKNKINKIK